MKLQEAVELIQQLEPAFAAAGHHLGLTGSVLFKGESSKDVDVIVYPHDVHKDRFFEPALHEFLAGLGFRTLPSGSSQLYHSDKLVIVSYRASDNQRVDWFLLV